MKLIVALCGSAFLTVPVCTAQSEKQQSQQASGLKNLTEDQRKRIYWEYSSIAERIRKETYRTYPADGPLDMAKERGRRDMSEKGCVATTIETSDTLRPA